MEKLDYLDAFLADERACGPNFRTFSATERRAMLQDDLFAGRSVSCILATIVTAGTLLMLGTVLWTI